MARRRASCAQSCSCTNSACKSTGGWTRALVFIEFNMGLLFRASRAYRLLLQSRNAALYEKHCALVTAEFVRISNDVRANEALLRSVDPKIADIVRALQQSEGEKLAKVRLPRSLLIAHEILSDVRVPSGFPALAPHSRRGPIRRNAEPGH